MPLLTDLMYALVDRCYRHGAANGAFARAFKPNLVDDLSGLTISNPPTQAEVTAIRDKMNELITALKT